jgi:hypothetical protein
MTEETKTKQPKLIPVRVVSQTGASATVEWFVKGAVKRGTLPIEKVTGDKLDQELLDAAVPYGIPWAEMAIKSYTGEQFQDAMYKADLWTDEQVRKNAQKVIGVLQELYRLHLGSISEFAAKYQKQ